MTADAQVHRPATDRTTALQHARSAIDEHGIETVLVAVPDVQGRLQGKFVDTVCFLEQAATQGIHACGYLFSVDVDMTPLPGSAASWDTGFGDMTMRPDLATFRPVPWQPSSAICLADCETHTGEAVAVAPRTVLTRQLERLAERGWRALAAGELELCLFRDGYSDARRRGYRELLPARPYNSDYALLDLGSGEDVLRRIRRELRSAGVAVEGSKGEANLGQFELNLAYTDALAAADAQALAKHATKEIAHQEGWAATFMAKPNPREGNAAHLHLSLRDDTDTPVFAEEPEVFGAFMAGLVCRLPDFAPLLAPTVNSYKRYRTHSFAPTNLSWGSDNRTCAFRVVGSGPSMRIENRLPGADCSPHLALAATIAAGLAGIEEGLALPEPTVGSAYREGGGTWPVSLSDAARRFAESEVATAALGDDVVAHLARVAAFEADLFDTAVTDWELERYFERM